MLHRLLKIVLLQQIFAKLKDNYMCWGIEYQMNLRNIKNFKGDEKTAQNAYKFLCFYFSFVYEKHYLCR